MPETIPDLWPDDIGTATLQTPLAILKQEAALLGQKTGQLVTAEVVTQAQQDSFIHSFFLIAPALDNYRYQLFRIQHGVSFYPMTVFLGGARDSVTSESQFLESLRAILSSPTTKNIVQSLIAQAKA